MTDDRFDLSLYKHTTPVRVRNYEVDWQGIVHNAVYLLYFEIGRVEYFRDIGAPLELGSVRGENKVVLVRNEIDYKLPVRFDAALKVHTRVSRIKNTSFWMEGVLELVSTGAFVATNVAYHVWLDHRTDRPRDVGDDFRKLVEKHEGDRCEIHWPVRKV
jgi:acyl-CoA thioester hydrolase